MNTAHKACPVCNHTLLGHEHDGWTCDCTACPWKSYNRKPEPSKPGRIVTISSPNLRPGDILIHKIGDRTREHKVISVYRKDTDRVEVGVTYLDGDHKVEWTYRLYHKVQVRRNPNPPALTIDWGMSEKELKSYIALLSPRRKTNS